MLSPLKGILRNRLLAILALFLAMLTAATSGFFLTLFTVYDFTHEIDVLQRKDFLTSAQPVQNSNACISDESNAMRDSHVSEAMSAAAQSESVKFVDNRALVLGYCENLTPVYDREMHRFKSLSESGDSLMHGAVFYNATYPNDMGMYESEITISETREEIIDDITGYVTYNQAKLLTSLYKSSYQEISFISYEYIILSRNGYDISTLQVGDRFLFWGKFFKDTIRWGAYLSSRRIGTYSKNFFPTVRRFITII